jgi:hypothetical protein
MPSGANTLSVWQGRVGMRRTDSEVGIPKMRSVSELESPTVGGCLPDPCKRPTPGATLHLPPLVRRIRIR